MSTETLRIAILGATGYTALELIKILRRHPLAEVRVVTSRQEAGMPICEVHPQLTGVVDLALSNVEPATLAQQVDLVFSCLPHAASATSIAPLVEAGCRVIDLSADYRLSDAATYEKWYEGVHPDPQRLAHVPYGLPELFARQIREATLVANPGCFPTGAILPLAPLLKSRLIDPHSVLVDSKTGISGAGRTPKLTTHFPECNESVVAYNVGRHRHTPEMEQVLSRVCDQEIRVVFTPHLVPMDRGILTTAYGRATGAVSQADALDCLRSFYESSPFIRVVDHLPATKDVSHSNRCHMTIRVVKDWVLAISCLDNLIKGASGAAVQNMNVMLGWDESLGLM